MEIKKRFPANVSLEQQTFLNDSNIDAELYSYLQQHSIVINGETVVLKKDLPSQVNICATIKVKSPKTYRVHLNYLIDNGFVEIRPEAPDRYYLPEKENIYLLLPLPTIQFLNDTAKEKVIKVYIYLFQRFKWKGPGYVFTIEELGQHIGMSVTGRERVYTYFKNVLTSLENNGLIEYEDFYDGKSHRKRLLNVSEFHKEEKKNG